MGLVTHALASSRLLSENGDSLTGPTGRNKPKKNRPQSKIKEKIGEQKQHQHLCAPRKKKMGFLGGKKLVYWNVQEW